MARICRSRMKLFYRNIASLILPVDSKGALLVLLWSTMMFIFQFFLINYVANDSLNAISDASTLLCDNINISGYWNSG